MMAVCFSSDGRPRDPTANFLLDVEDITASNTSLTSVLSCFLLLSVIMTKCLEIMSMQMT